MNLVGRIEEGGGKERESAIASSLASTESATWQRNSQGQEDGLRERVKSNAYGQQA